MTNCPLCNTLVHYEGLFSIECSGPHCPNYKPPPLYFVRQQRPKFDNVLLDWEWFTDFTNWLQTQFGRPLMPFRPTNDILGIMLPDSTHLAWPMAQTTRAMLRDNLLASEWYGLKNPFYEIFAEMQ